MKTTSVISFQLPSGRAPRSRRRHVTGLALVSCGLELSVACSDDDGSDTPLANAGSGGSSGAAGSAGNAGRAGSAGSPADDAGTPGNGPSGTVTVLDDDAEGLQNPTTAAVRGSDLWVVNGQLAPLFNPAAVLNLPFNIVSIPLAGGDIGATDIVLPGDDFFPEGIAAAADGTLYVGSVTQGVVLRIAATATEPDADPFVEAGVAERGVIGLTVDEARSTLWFCDSSPTAPGGAIVGVDLETGVETVRHAMPDPIVPGGADAGAPPDASDAGTDAGDAGSGDAGTVAAPAAPATFCNDLIVAGGDIFATDTSGRIFRVPSDDVDVDDSAEVWLENPSALPAGGFGPNGIDLVGDTLIIASNGALLAVDPDSNNPAAALRTVTLSEGGAPGTLCGPDGLQTVPGSDDEIIVVENGFCTPARERVVKVTLSNLD